MTVQNVDKSEQFQQPKPVASTTSQPSAEGKNVSQISTRGSASELKASTAPSVAASVAIRKKTVSMMTSSSSGSSAVQSSLSKPQTKTKTNLSSNLPGEDSTAAKKAKLISSNNVVNSNGTISVPSRYLQSSTDYAAVLNSTATATAAAAMRAKSARITRTPASSSSSSSASASSSSRAKSATTAAAAASAQQKRKEADDESALLASMLKKHNERFAPVPAYEPPRHSVREVRQWEKISGNTNNLLITTLVEYRINFVLFFL